MRIVIGALAAVALLWAGGGGVAAAFPVGGAGGGVPDTSRYVPVERYAGLVTPFASLSVKSNLLQWVGTRAPNVGLEVGLGRRSSLELSAGYGLQGDDGGRFLALSTARAEFRYWPRERFRGHFFGVHPVFLDFEVGGYDFLSLFEKAFRYEGSAVGGGLSYGYHLVVGRHWALEFGASGGALLLEYDRFERTPAGGRLNDYKKIYFGLTNASVSLVFMIK
jgi:hypothetical protein